MRTSWWRILTICSNESRKMFINGPNLALTHRRSFLIWTFRRRSHSQLSMIASMTSTIRPIWLIRYTTPTTRQTSMTTIVRSPADAKTGFRRLTGTSCQWSNLKDELHWSIIYSLNLKRNVPLRIKMAMAGNQQNRRRVSRSMKTNQDSHRGPSSTCLSW